jgi:hypothetical protein
MMRGVTALGLVAALAVGVETGSSHVQAMTEQTVPGTWVSSITVLNPGTNTAAANISVTFYDSSGAAKATVCQGNCASPATPAVAPGGTAFWYVPNIAGLTAGQTYSAVVSADQQVYATVNLSSTNPSTAESYDGAGTNGGAMDTASTEYIASVLREYFGYSSTVVVQNTGSAAANVSLTLVGGGSSGAINTTLATQTIQPNASFTWDLESPLTDNHGNPVNLGTGFNGGATISGGGQNIAVISNTYTPSATPSLFQSVNGFATGATTVYAPGLYKNYHGYVSSLIVQNADTTPANVMVSYAGTTATDSVSGLAPGASKVFYTPNNTGLPNGWIGSATVTSTGGQKILAQVNINASGVAGIGQASYGGFEGGTINVFAPGLLRNYHGNISSFTVQNVDTIPANFTLTYSNGCQEQVTNLAPGTSKLFYQGTDACVTDGFNGGATVVSTNGAKLVGLININGGITSDQLYSTNAFGS